MVHRRMLAQKTYGGQYSETVRRQEYHNLRNSSNSRNCRIFYVFYWVSHPSIDTCPWTYIDDMIRNTRAAVFFSQLIQHCRCIVGEHDHHLRPVRFSGRNLPEEIAHLAQTVIRSCGAPCHKRIHLVLDEGGFIPRITTI